MKSIEHKTQYEIKIQKSRFITLLYPLQRLDEVSIFLNQAKEKYSDATHHCYAYIFDKIERFSDDGEPSGTAGMPMLHVLKNQALDHLLVIVVRYFGGIKLGAGGLVRAYSNSVSEALLHASIVFLEKGWLITIQFPYTITKDVDYACKDFTICKKEYHNDIQYQVEVPITQYERFKKHMKVFHVSILEEKEIYIKKCNHQ